MGKPRIKNTGLPKNVYLKHGAYYYVRDNKWTRLAKKGDESGMYKALSSIFRTENRKPTMLNIFERYEREILPKKAQGTIKDQ